MHIPLGIKQTAHLEDWSYANETLYGIVSDHPRLVDGMLVRTSYIVKLDTEKKTCETMNTHYTLGKPWVLPVVKEAEVEAA